MSNTPKFNMNNDLLTLLHNMKTAENKEKFLEGMAVIGDDVSRKIIAKASSPHSPVAINEFPDIRETTMIRYLYLLQGAGILVPIWENDQKKFKITDLGREIDGVLSNSNL